MRDGAGEGHGVAYGCRLHRHGAVVEQPVRPVLVADRQRLADQQGAKASAVDEQIAFDACTGVQLQGADLARRRIALHADDLAFDAMHAERFAEAAQEAGVEGGVQVVGVVQAVVGQVRKAAGLRCLRFERVGAVVGRQLPLAALEPEVLEACGPVVLAGLAEAVEVVPAHLAPALEPDAQLEGGLRGGHEGLFVYAQQAVEGLQRRDGRLAHAHGADLVGLDQRDVQQRAQRLGQPCSDHPACGATACDDDTPDGRTRAFGWVAARRVRGVCAHRFRLLRRRARNTRAAFGSSGRRPPRAAVGMCSWLCSSAAKT
jgi:hypothetical protein